MSSAKSESTPTYRLTFTRKVLFGVGGFVDVWPIWVPMTLASPVLSIQLGIAPWIVSTMFMAYRLWDAMSDPVMGWISDNTRTRWGRRRPYIFLAAILVGLTFPLMWLFPREASAATIIAWVSVGAVLLYTASTIWGIPYQSLFLELTPDYNERTRINSFRFLSGLVFGAAIGWSWYFARLPIFGDPVTGEPDTLNGVIWVSAIMGGIAMLFGLLPAIFIRERFAKSGVTKRQEKTSIWQDVRLTLRNRNFLMLITAILFFVGGTSLINNFGQFIGTYYVFRGDETAAAEYGGWGSNLYTAGVACGILLMGAVSQKLSKEKTMAIAMGVLALAMFAQLFTLRPGEYLLSIIPSFFVGFGTQAAWLMAGSMNADVADEDEYLNGKRREGSFASIFAWVTKLSFTLGFGLSGPLLTTTGFEVAAGVDQEGVFWRMKLIMSLLPTAAILVTIWLLLTKYRLSKERSHMIRLELEARRGVV